MNKHISMRFDFVDEHVSNIKSISSKVGGVAIKLSNCSSILKSGSNVADSLYRQLDQSRRNIKEIQHSLTEAYTVLDKVRDLYYKTEKNNYTIISGLKPYEDMNTIERLKYHSNHVGKAVRAKIDQCMSPFKDYLPGGQYWEATKQSLKLVAVATTAVVSLAAAMAAPMVGIIGITVFALNSKKIIAGVAEQSKNWTYSMTGEYDKIDDVSWLDIGLQSFKTLKNIGDLKKYKDILKISGTIFDVSKDMGEYINDAYRYAVGIDPNMPSMDKTGSNIFFSVLDQGFDFLGDKNASNYLKIGKELYKYSSKMVFQN